MNIQAYAGDLVLLSLSSSGLQKLLGRAGELLAEETYMLILNFVDSFKYLGRILSKNSADFCDIDRC